MGAALGAGLLLVVVGAEVRGEACAHGAPLPREVERDRRPVQLAQWYRLSRLRMWEIYECCTWAEGRAGSL